MRSLRSLRFFGGIAVLGGVWLVLSACSDDSDPVGEASPDAGTPSLEAAAPDAADARVDAPEIDAGPKTCSDDGYCHTEVPADETLRAVWSDGASGGVVWSVSEEGDVLRWDGTWKVHTSGLGKLLTIWGSSPTDIWIGGEKGLYHGTGETSATLAFELVSVPAAETDPADVSIRSIWGTGPSDIWAVGGDFDTMGVPTSRFLHRSAKDAGAEWAIHPLALEGRVFRQVWGSATSGTWALGDDAFFVPATVLYHRAKNATDFVPVPITAFNPAEGPVNGLIRTITAGGATEDGRLLIAGDTGFGGHGYWHGTPSTNGDLTWEFGSRDYQDPILNAVWSGSANQTWIAGDYGRLRLWDGSKWTIPVIKVTPFPVIEPLYGVGGSSGDDFWVVGKNTALHHTPSAAKKGS